MHAAARDAWFCSTRIGVQSSINTLYEGPFVWMQGSRTDFRVDTLVSGGLVFVGDTFKGLHISVFDGKGTLLRTIDENADVEEVPNRARLRQFWVSAGRIYATTYKRVDGKTEMIVLDLEGRILGRLFLPLTSMRPERGALRYGLLTVSRGKLYELVQTAGKDTWELVVTDLEAVPSPPRVDSLRAPDLTAPTSKSV